MARHGDDGSLSPLMLDDSFSSSTSSLGSPRFAPPRFASGRRRVIVATTTVFSLLSLVALAYLSFSQPHIASQDPILSSNSTPTWDRKSALLGPPTSRFRGSSQDHPTFFPP